MVIYKVSSLDGDHIRNQGATELPAIVVAAHSDTCANLQIFVDGSAGVAWRTSVLQGTEPGSWHWPERV